VESWSRQYTKFEVNEKLNAIDVPCGPIMDTSDLINDEHLRVREMIVDVSHPQRGTFKTVGSPLKLSDSQVEIFSSPLFGEHTEEVLRELMGYDKDRVEQLRKEGVV
jgi:formyl-CoA transferase